MNLIIFKRAVRAQNLPLIAEGIREYRRNRVHLKFTEQELYRLAIAGDPELTRDAWNDLVVRALA